MSAISTDCVAAISRLPAGAALRVDNVAWDEYEQLLADLGDDYNVRVFYDDGRMEITSADSGHERRKMILHTLVTALSDELDIDIESLGSTTLKAEMKAKGAEPDDCFYIQNAQRVIGKMDLDLANDPPLDIVVEIDRTNASLNKLPIYAALGVPEIWRLSGREVHFYLLTGDRYEQ